jgi:8-oxo-dGTP pyrophosphatase MutT (NUDIX family)
MVVLVDRRGWILLQERDEYAPIAPDQWGFVGGHVEDGESFEAAVHRELEEETGIVGRPGCACGARNTWGVPIARSQPSVSCGSPPRS